MAFGRLASLSSCRGSGRNRKGASSFLGRRGHGAATEQSDYEATAQHDAVIDVEERREIARILPYLEDGERVLVVARQSRVLPGATLVFTPDTIFCTAQRTIIRNPMMLGLREHVDFYRHRDVKSARLVRGRFTSSLMLTVPGMGTAARSASGAGDGIISAIPHSKAEEIYRIIQGGGRRGASRTSRNGRGNSGGGDARSPAGSRTSTGDRASNDNSSGGARNTAAREGPRAAMMAAEGGARPA